MKTKQLIKEMNQYSTKLTKEHQEIFDKILLKIRFSKLDEQDAEEFSHHCLNLLLQAEEEKKDVALILGTHHIEEFCNEYIEEVSGNYSWLKKIILTFQDIFIIIAIFTGVGDMLLSYLIPTWIKYKMITLTVPLTIAMVINGVFGYIVTKMVMHYLPRISWDLNHGSKKNNRKWLFMIYLGSCVAIAFLVVSKILFAQVLFELNFLAYILGVEVLYILLKVIGRNLD